MDRLKLGLVFTVISLMMVGCNSSSTEGTERGVTDTTVAVFVPKDVYTVPVQELTDDAYPDNPDIGFRSAEYGEFSHKTLNLSENEDGTFRFEFLPSNDKSDTVVFPAIDVMSYMIDVPEWVKKDEYLTFIGLVNLEWNRQQVRFDKDKDYWSVNGSNGEADRTIRIDIARNCLNSGLWEVAMFEPKPDGGNTIYYHGWFTFPLDLYGHLFNKKTGLDFADFEEHLVDWKEPRREKVSWSVLKVSEQEIANAPVSLNNELYPLTGARVKKEKNIVAPRNHNVINDFLSDETKYSTFSPPGFYDTHAPRPTLLSLLKVLEGGAVSQIQHQTLTDTVLHEVRIDLSTDDSSKKHSIYFGGIDLRQLPVLTLQDHNKGLKMPMGLSNHSFYETYDKCLSNPTIENPYYGLVLNDQDVWFDSHSLGIDGPIMFWDAEDESILHVMILSFERHSFVGHYTFEVDKDKL